MTQTTKTSDSDGSSRVSAIESFFVTDGDKFKCNIKNAAGSPCGSVVRCQERRGAPGRLQHIQHRHAEEYAKLPAKKPRNAKSKRPRGKEGTDCGVEADDVAVILWLARRAHPLTELDDEWVKTKTTLTRKNVMERAAPLAKSMMGEVLAELRGKTCCLSLDGGTNAGTKTVDICAVHNGVSHFIKAVHCGTSSLEITAVAVGHLAGNFILYFFNGKISILNLSQASNLQSPNTTQE